MKTKIEHIISISDDDSSEDEKPLHLIKNGYTENSSDDELPLVLMKNGPVENPNSYSSLCKHSIEACEFCEMVFENRFSSLVHNVKHIIIPLINQTVYQCDDCLYYFTSQQELRAHKFIKHHILMAPQILVKKEFDFLTKAKPIDIFKETETETEIIEHKNESSRGSSVEIIEDEDVIETLQNNLKEELRQPFKIDLKEDLIQPFKNDLKKELIQPFKNNLKKELVQPFKNDLEEPVEPLKNRLVFEDDLVVNCDRLLNDLTTDCKVNLEKPPWLDVEFKSVHYDELVKPGFYRCKKCSRGFPIRYEAIIHETSHLSISNSQVNLCRMCNEYILGNKNNLRLHYLSKHRQQTTQSITSCNTDYITKKVIRNESEEKVQETFYKKTIKLCDLCLSFCKNKAWINYECVGELSEPGKRFECEKCGSKFFDIKLVKREMKFRKAYIVHKKKARSNEERLKTIQQRFKMMKMLKK